MRKDRIEARLAALGITQFEAAERAGKNAHFIYDFMIGRKRSFKGDGPVRVAQALQCSVEYLTGESDEVGSPPAAFGPLSTSGPFLPLAGIVEAGVYRRAWSATAQRPPVDVPPRPGFPPEAQALYLVRGGGMDARGIIEGMLLVAVSADAAKDKLESGAIVIVEHYRGSGREVETSARELQYFPDRTELRAQSKTENIKPIILRDGKPLERDGKVKIVALVIEAILKL